MKTDTFIDAVMTMCVTFISINDLQSVMSISMLVIQCVYIVVRFMYKLYVIIVNKKGNIKDEIKDTMDSLEDLTDNGKLDGSNKKEGKNNEHYKSK